MEKKTEEEYKIFAHEGIDYLTFPQAWTYIGKDQNRDALHQRILRDQSKRVLKVGRYVFVTLEYCNKLRAEFLQKQRQEKLSVLGYLDLTTEEIQSIIELKKKKKLNSGNL